MALCMNDEILLLQLKRGNQLAFTSIYNKYAREAYVLAFKYLGSKELAEDAVQNLFLKIWNIREEIDETRPFNYFFVYYSSKQSAECVARLQERLFCA